jgi:hypothetical protein
VAHSVGPTSRATCGGLPELPHSDVCQVHAHQGLVGLVHGGPRG